jgi:hypothetical protein
VIRMNDERTTNKALQQTREERCGDAVRDVWRCSTGDVEMQYGRTVLNYLERKNGKQRPRVDNFGRKSIQEVKARYGCSAVEEEEDYIFATGWTTGRSMFDPRREQRIFPVTSVSRPALGPTQPPVQWVPGVLSPGVKRGRSVTLTTHPHLVPRLRMIMRYISSPPSAFVVCSGTSSAFGPYCNFSLSDSKQEDKIIVHDSNHSFYTALHPRRQI